MTGGEALDRGTTLAGYRIERVIGSGRMGTIYLAQSPDLPRHDALKVLNRDLADDPVFRARFVREADVGAQLSHPNVVAVYRRGSTEDGGLWIAMQYVDGVDADTALRGGMMTPARAVHIVGEIAKALDYAHSKGVVHRDVKPANFLLSGAVGRDERVFLGDFGIAHSGADDHTDTDGPIVATVAYAAPEVLNRQPLDGRADIYSLGCSLFRMLTATMPFPSNGDAEAVIRSHLQAPPPRVTAVAPGLSSAFDAVIAKVMAKDPADRFQTGQDFASAALAALRPAAPSPRPSPSPAPQPSVSPPPRPTPASAIPRHRLEEATSSVAGDIGGRGNSVGSQAAEDKLVTGSAAASPFVDPATLSAPASRLAGKDHRRLLKVGGAVVGSAALVAVIALVVTGQESDSHSPAPSPSVSASATPTRTADADARLLKLIPPGYPPDACHAVDPTDGAEAKVTCAAAVDAAPVAPAPVDPAAPPGAPAPAPGGTATANYFLMPGKQQLAVALDKIVRESTVVTCPGNIQSPGPWRRNATPQLVSGTVFCGLDASTTTVGWSTEDQSLITVVQAPVGGPNLDQLYGWWSTHS